MSVVAVDVGGTLIKGGRTDSSGAFDRTSTVPTPTHGGADAVVGAIVSFVDSLRANELEAVGVVVPGAVADGLVRYAANLPFRSTDLRGRLAAALGVPVAVGHDVAAAAEAEAAATGASDLLFVALGTGVAAANVRAGRADRGATGQAAEIGHLVVVPGGEPCTCGNRGCVEVYASAASIARRYRESSGIAEADARYVVSVVDTDRLAAAVWQDAVDALAAGLAAATMLLDPPVIVIGGGLSGAGEKLLEPVRKALADLSTWRVAPALRAGELGPMAGLYGAARLALQLENTEE